MSTYTTKGFTGQYADAVTGLDYYNARYYDPVAGVFLSADSVQGNMQGMNPYGYVGGNPETDTDPTGKYYAPPGGPGGPTPPPPCNQSNNFCGTGNGENPGGGNSGGGTKQTQKKTGVKLGGCNPDTDQSQACGNWAYRASQVRNQRLDELNNLEYLALAGAYLLELVGDILAFSNSAESALARIDALIQMGSDVATNLLPTLAHIFGGAILEAALYIDQWVSAFLAGAKTILAAASSTVWWIADPAQIALTAALDASGGPAELMVQGLMILTKPALGYLLSAGGSILQSAASANFAEAQHESNMSLQSWCTQYGGCPSLSS